MGLILFGFVTVAAAFALARFTRLHPLAVASIGGAIWACFGGLVAMTFSTSPDWPVIAVATFVVGLFPAGIGAFLGWLRRTHLERVIS